MLPDSTLECKCVNSIEIKGVTPGLNLGHSSPIWQQLHYPSKHVKNLQWLLSQIQCFVRGVKLNEWESNAQPMDL